MFRDLPNQDNVRPNRPYLEKVREHEQDSKVGQRKCYNASHCCTKLPSLNPGGHVWVVSLKTPAVVTEKAATLMSYVVETQNSSPVWRKRRHFISIPESIQQEFPLKHEDASYSPPHH